MIYIYRIYIYICTDICRYISDAQRMPLCCLLACVVVLCLSCDAFLGVLSCVIVHCLPFPYVVLSCLVLPYVVCRYLVGCAVLSCLVLPCLVVLSCRIVLCCLVYNPRQSLEETFRCCTVLELRLCAKAKTKRRNTQLGLHGEKHPHLWDCWFLSLWEGNRQCVFGRRRERYLGHFDGYLHTYT
jgi:hypothetical protein